MPYGFPANDSLPSPDAIHTMIVALQHSSRHAKIDKVTAHVLGQAANMLATFDRHRGMYEKRRATLYRTMSGVLHEYCTAPAELKRNSEYEVMIDLCLCANALERDEPIAWIPGQLVGPLFLPPRKAA